MLKIMTIVGTRPELIKMSRVIAEFDSHTNHLLVHTGQNYDFELNEIFFDDLEIRQPDYFLGAAGENTAKTIAQVIEKSDEIFEKEMPDAVLFYGDTNSSLAVIAAKRRKIPVFHMEAGNRCFDQRVPEELNRKVIDHLSDINFVLTEHARSYLISEGIRPERVIKTGSHMREVLDFYNDKINASDVIDRLRLQENNYFIISAHREENVDCRENLKDLLDTLNSLAEIYNIPVIVSTHPRTKKRLEDFDLGELNSKISFLKPFGFCDFIKLQLKAFCVISDSGTLTEEAAMLNLPAIMIRNTHERPEGMDSGTLIMSGLKKNRVLDAITVITSQRKSFKFPNKPPLDYNSNIVSKQILRVVLSYVDFINDNIWYKK
jgi:UDP-N-acetylglucosamine 2-epimerase (non-hydrolysing)